MQIIDPTDRKAIGSALMHARSERNLTQRKLAEASGVPQGEISRIERGARDVTLPWLNDIAKALGQNVSIALTPKV